jgi:hypothetical protein
VSEQESDEDYQARMDQLARKVSAVLEDEDYTEVATVLSGMASFAIVASSPSVAQRERLLTQLVEFMDRQIHKELSSDD